MDWGRDLLLNGSLSCLDIEENPYELPMFILLLSFLDLHDTLPFPAYLDGLEAIKVSDAEPSGMEENNY